MKVHNRELLVGKNFFTLLCNRNAIALSSNSTLDWKGVSCLKCWKIRGLKNDKEYYKSLKDDLKN